MRPGDRPIRQAAAKTVCAGGCRLDLPPIEALRLIEMPSKQTRLEVGKFCRVLSANYEVCHRIRHLETTGETRDARMLVEKLPACKSPQACENFVTLLPMSCNATMRQSCAAKSSEIRIPSRSAFKSALTLSNLTAVSSVYVRQGAYHVSSAPCSRTSLRRDYRNQTCRAWQTLPTHYGALGQ